MKVRTVPLHELTPDPSNTRLHDDRNLDAIKASLDRFGQVKPIVVTDSNVIVAGNGTYAAALDLGWASLQVVTIDDADPAALRAYAIADNRTAELAAWDHELLTEQLHELTDDLLAATGFDLDELPAALGLPPGFEADEAREDLTPRESSLLALIDVTTGEPRHPVEHGQAWSLSGRHVLVVASVFTDWPLWIDHLQPGRLLLPMPEPHVTQGPKAASTDLVLIQPSTYLAGHLLDCHAERFGEDSLVAL